jgi:hypothetical protein
VPILPGKEEQDRQAMGEAAAGRREEAEAAWKRHGITRHAVCHQETPDGAFAVVFIEADDIAAAMQGMGSSDDPFDRWFRETIKEVHGIDIATDPPPQSQQLFDIQP